MDRESPIFPQNLLFAREGGGIKIIKFKSSKAQMVHEFRNRHIDIC